MSRYSCLSILDIIECMFFRATVFLRVDGGIDENIHREQAYLH